MSQNVTLSAAGMKLTTFRGIYNSNKRNKLLDLQNLKKMCSLTKLTITKRRKNYNIRKTSKPSHGLIYYSSHPRIGTNL